jgi:hypothetical protein
MLTIPFSYNWNNKLDCHAFTTIGLYNPDTHKQGTKVNAVLKGMSKGTGVIVDVKPFLLQNLNPYMSYLDTGYAVQECKNIINTMYPKVDFTKKQLAFILIVKDKK